MYEYAPLRLYFSFRLFGIRQLSQKGRLPHQPTAIQRLISQTTLFSPRAPPPLLPGPPRGMPISSPPSRVRQSQLVGTTSSASTTRRTLTLILSPAPRAPCSADLADAGQWMSG